MKVFTASSALLCGALLIGASGLNAQTGNNWYDQWFQAKFGRPSPMVEAQQNADRRAAASAIPWRQETIIEPMLQNNWYDYWFQAKFGRPSPMVEAQQRADQRAVASAIPWRQETIIEPMLQNTWYDHWFQGKFGRPSPIAEGRQPAAREETITAGLPNN